MLEAAGLEANSKGPKQPAAGPGSTAAIGSRYQNDSASTEVRVAAVAFSAEGSIYKYCVVEKETFRQPAYIIVNEGESTVPEAQVGSAYKVQLPNDDYLLLKVIRIEFDHDESEFKYDYELEQAPGNHLSDSQIQQLEKA